MMARALMILNTFLFREKRCIKSIHKCLLRSNHVPIQACYMVPMKIRQ